jgi:predicted dehydrogenase
MKRLHTELYFFTMIILMSCQSVSNQDTVETRDKPVKLVTVDPGHFHAALVQKTMYDDVDSIVYVYAPEGNDLKLHLDRINGFNTRTDNPTRWKQEIYSGPDFFEKMITEKKGNVVVLAGNNETKTEYILKSLEAGFNVLADKPMAITPADFELLKKAFDVAREKDLLLYDIMTERFEITSILQKEISMITEIFGTLDTGTVGHPAVEMTSDHNFYKNVSGNIVVRPPWFMDASQQGNGIVDVTTHLVDLVQWECFPGQSLDYAKDIIITDARRWPTAMSVRQFKTITRLDEVPSFIEKDNQHDSLLKVWSNGEIRYKIKGVHAKVSVVWKYQTESGTDTHYSIMRGTKANLVIRQGKEENYKPVLYIEPVKNDSAFNRTVNERIKTLSTRFPGIELNKSGNGWSVRIPQTLAEGHEAHFARVTINFLEYLKNKNMPAWEVPNMLAKYYTTTRALEVALNNK